MRSWSTYDKSFVSLRLIRLARRSSLRQALALRRDQLNARLARLTDALLDTTLTKQEYNERKTALLEERQRLDDQISNAVNMPDLTETVRDAFELASDAYLLYETVVVGDKRELLEIVCSNMQV